MNDAFIVRIKKNFKTIAGDWRIYLFLIPMIVWFALFVYKPMGGLLVAFKNYDAADGVFGSEFSGLAHFQTLLFGGNAELFWKAFRNTFLISLYGLIFAFPIPIILAILFSEIIHDPYRKVAQTLSYLPYFLSEVTITGLIIAMLRYQEGGAVGVLARMLYMFGVPEKTVILNTAGYFRPLYIISGIWKEAGYNSIVFFAAIMGVSPVLYEALKVDGGNKLQELRYVTIPGISSTLIIMIIMRIGRMLSVGYERVILLYNQTTYETGDVLSSLAYRLGLLDGKTALGSAIDIFNSVLGFFLVIGANYVSKKVSDTSLW